MCNWMKWLRLLRGWHFIAATAIKPWKAACQFAADDILLYEFCYYNPIDLLHHLEKGKEELSPLQYHIKSLQYHIKTLQEEFSKKSNIPWIWRIIYGHKLPYMKKTRKKKQVCGAACFMAAEIKFSKDVRLSVRPSRTMLPLLLFKYFIYQPEIWWDDVQYHGGDPYLKWPSSANFCMFYRTLKFSMIGFTLLTRSEGWHYHSNSLRISGISLKFGGMMHSYMKQIAI